MTAVARDKGREDPFSVTGAIPGLIQRCQNGSEVRWYEDPRHPGVRDWGIDNVIHVRNVNLPNRKRSIFSYT